MSRILVSALAGVVLASVAGIGVTTADNGASVSTYGACSYDPSADGLGPSTALTLPDGTNIEAIPGGVTHHFIEAAPACVVQRGP